MSIAPDANLAAEWPTMGGAKADLALAAVKALSAIPYVVFHSANNNVHIIVESTSGHKRVDLWPTTGLWKVPGRKEKNYGLKSLLDYIQTWA